MTSVYVAHKTTTQKFETEEWSADERQQKPAATTGRMVPLPVVTSSHELVSAQRKDAPI